MRDMNSLLGVLRRVCEPFGIVSDLRGESFECADKTLHLYRARIHSISRSGFLPQTLTGFGFSDDAQLAEIKAIGEGLERFCGVNFSSRNAIHTTWKEISASAIHPSACLQYDDDQYLHKDCPLQKFDERKVSEWVPAYRYKTKEQLFIHADLVRMSHLSKIAKTSSIGMAIHTNIGVAEESALLELIERDHLALAFWHGEGGGQLDLEGMPDRIQVHLKALRDDGFRVYALLYRFNLNFPVVLWLAFRSTGLPYFLKGASSHKDIHVACEKSFDELLRSFLYYKKHPFVFEKKSQGAAKNLMFYQTPDAEMMLNFLLDTGTVAKMEDKTGNCSASIFDCVEEAGFPVFFVQMSHPLVVDLGMKCVRAVVPGLVRTPLGSEPWQLAARRLRRTGSDRDTGTSKNPP